MSTIEGHCHPRFAAVREAFEGNFAEGLEVGASFAATLDGEMVVDLWGGLADARSARPWQRDTLVNVFSTTKAMTALCAHILVDRGLLDVDLPVAHYWPEFAQAGKQDMPVRHLLTHQAGLAAIREPLPLAALYDWQRMTEVLAAEEPWWTPGSTSGYHAMTFGFLVGEIIRRIDGRSVGRFIREEVAEPLSADFYIGLPESEDARVATMIAPTIQEMKAAGRPAAADPNSMLGKVMGNPPITPSAANRPEWRRAEIPAANGHGNARSVARALSALALGGTVDGVRLLQRATLERAIARQWQGNDLVLGLPLCWGLGFMLTSEALPLGPNPRIFGHGGWGGSLGFVDPDAGISWAYVMNKMSTGTAGDIRGFRMAGALYGSL